MLKQAGKYVVGLTISRTEAELCKDICDRVIVGDIEAKDEVINESFDCIIMSHICEHLVDPHTAVKKVIRNLEIGGRLIIALPNMAYYKSRLRIMKGNWSMEETGHFDKTHLHFYSYDTSDQIAGDIKNLNLAKKIAGDVSIPLWPLRKVFPSISHKLDRLIGPMKPNLFSLQTVLVYEKF